MKNETKTKLLKELEKTIDNFFKDDSPKDLFEITTIEEVCKRAGENPDDYVIPANATKRQRGKILFATMELICDVFKDGVILDYSNSKQDKWYLWGEHSAGSGFSLGDVFYDFTLSFVGARLSVDTKPKAEHIWKYFSHIWIEFWLGK